MTRFWITLQQGVDFVLASLQRMQGGELFVPKIPSMRIVDLARVIAPDAELKVVGIRPGEKIHEEMISLNDARRTLDLDDHYVIQPEMTWWKNGHANGKAVPDGFAYTSDRNDRWVDEAQLRTMIADT